MAVVELRVVFYGPARSFTAAHSGSISSTRLPNGSRT